MGSGGGEGEAHGCHADNDEVDISRAVGGEEVAVEGEVGGIGRGADEGLTGNGFVAVDDGGFEAGVRFLRQGAEHLSRDEVVDVEVALGHVGGVAAQMAQGVPGGYVALVVFGFVVFAGDEYDGGQFNLAGAEGGRVGGVAMIDDEGEVAGVVGKGGVDKAAQALGVARGEEDPRFALQLGMFGELFEEVDESMAAAEDKDMVGEVVAGKSVTVVVAAVEEDGGEGSDKEGSEEGRADDDNEELEKQRETRAKGEVAGIEEETGGFGPAGYAASSGEGERGRRP